MIYMGQSPRHDEVSPPQQKILYETLYIYIYIYYTYIHMQQKNLN